MFTFSSFLCYSIQTMRILVVEDNEKLARSIKKGLEQEGYAVDHISDGEAAERRIELHSSDYDLVILDLMLPGRDGLTICASWRRASIMLPVIMLTAKDTNEDKVLGLDCGADDYLVKPFSFEELLARIRALLRRPALVMPLELSRHGISLNSSTRKVTYFNKEISLTLKEYSLLEYFMRHPGQVLTREQIIASLWDFAFDSLSNIVDVHVKNLRTKFRKNDGKRLFETIHGVGYRFKE